MYLDYDEYLSYGGTIADEDVYNRIEMKARRLIDKATRGRVMNEVIVRESVKNCTYDLVKIMYAQEMMHEMTAGREVLAMSNDGVSISFAGTNTSESGVAMVFARYMRTIREWLEGETTDNGVSLLYAGVDA